MYWTLLVSEFYKEKNEQDGPSVLRICDTVLLVLLAVYRFMYALQRGCNFAWKGLQRSDICTRF